MALSFEQAYPVLYKGWDPVAARADFQATGGRNKAGYTELVGGGGGGSAAPIPTISRIDPLETARQLQQFQVQANQPAIQTLEAQKAPLSQRYKELIESIGQKEQVATKRTETGATREFAARGLLPSSDAFTGFLQERLEPLTAQFGGLRQQATQEEGRDLMGIASQIASLRAGNAPQALSTAMNIINMQQQAEQIAEQARASQAAEQLSRERFEFEKSRAAQAGAGGGGGVISSILSQLLPGLNQTPSENIPKSDWEIVPSRKSGGFGMTTRGFA